ncbi:MAG: hypothetical protein M1816_004725, partial [Peltula sp. TS41687]
GGCTFTETLFAVLDVAKEAYLRFSENEIWLPDYIKNKIKAAFEADDTLFRKGRFLSQIGTVAAFDKAVVNSIVETYTEKIGGMVSKEEACCKGSSYEQAETEPCDEISYEAVPCEEPPEETSADAYDEVTYNKVAYEDVADCKGAAYEEAASCEDPADITPRSEYALESQQVLETQPDCTPPPKPTCEPTAEGNNSHNGALPRAAGSDRVDLIQIPGEPRQTCSQRPTSRIKLHIQTRRPRPPKRNEDGLLAQPQIDQDTTTECDGSEGVWVKQGPLIWPPDLPADSAPDPTLEALYGILDPLPAEKYFPLLDRDHIVSVADERSVVT